MTILEFMSESPFLTLFLGCLLADLIIGCFRAYYGRNQDDEE